MAKHIMTLLHVTWDQWKVYFRIASLSVWNRGLFPLVHGYVFMHQINIYMIYLKDYGGSLKYLDW